MLKYPELLPINWNDPNMLDKCYQVYLDEIFKGNLTFLGKKIHYDNNTKEDDDKHACFWHLITRTIKEFNERYPNRERMERLRWTPFILKNHMSVEITCWEELVHTKNRGKKYQTFLWDKKHEFVVILEKQNKNTYRLVSSYCVDEKWAKQNFKNKCKKHEDPRKISRAQQ